MSEMNKKIFWVEGILQVFIALGAVGGGLVLLLDTSGGRMGFSVEMLSGSPFPNYLVPGLVLFTINGIGNFVAAFLSFRQHRFSAYAGIALGGFLAVWILIQVMIIGWVSWLQPFMLFLGLVELALGVPLYKTLKRELS